MEKESHVVVIFPHPDDESFGTAGSIKQFRSEGVPVTYLCGTSGEMGRNMGTPPFANRETLWEIREKELKDRSEEHTSELQSRGHLVCRLLPESKKRTSSEGPVI